jgi:hypothetical protein
MDLDGFLGHETRAKFGGKFLRGWKKRGSVTTVLHMRAPIIAVWQHPLPRVVEVKGEHGSSNQVWSGSWNCLESEEVLQLQYKRDYDSGERTVLPQICPACILVETVRAMIESGELQFCEPVLRWQGDDPKKAQTFTAAGMINLYRSTKLTEDQKEAMRVARVRPSEAWKETLYAKCKYLFTVVDVDKPQDGVQVALETTLLGDKVKEEIAKAMTREGSDAGNPLKNPYAIRWVYDEHAATPLESYSAIVLGKWRDPETQTPWIDAQIRDLITQAPPDVGKLMAPGNVAKLRDDLEAHALVKMPWDDIFGPAEDAAGDADSSPPEPAQRPAEVKPAPEPAPKAEPSQSATAPKESKSGDTEPAVPSDDGEDADTFGCDKCGEPMRIDEFVCPNFQCKAKYDKATGELIEKTRSKIRPPKTEAQLEAERLEQNKKKREQRREQKKKKDAELWGVGELDDLPF